MTSKTNSADRQELYKLLQESERFVNWNKPPDKLRPEDVNPKFSALDEHFTPQQLADAWGVSDETIRQIFRDEQGVLKIGKSGTKVKRGLRIASIEGCQHNAGHLPADTLRNVVTRPGNTTAVVRYQGLAASAATCSGDGIGRPRN